MTYYVCITFLETFYHHTSQFTRCQNTLKFVCFTVYKWSSPFIIKKTLKSIKTIRIEIEQ